MHLQPSPDKLSALVAFANLKTKANARAHSRSLSALTKRNAAIIEALADGHSAGAIGLKIGLSESTVSDIARRRNKVGQEPRPAVAASRGILRGKVSFDQAGPIAVAVLNAQPGTCRWPIDGDEDFRFCGAAVVSSRSGGLTMRSFCAAHSDRAYAGRRTMVAEAV